MALCAAYGRGPVLRLAGIAGGSVNTNYAVREPAGCLFLRLYEEQDRAGAEREAALLERLAAKGVPTPRPLRRQDGGFVSLMLGKPAALFPWCDGGMRCQASVTPDDARGVGAALARVHVAGEGEAASEGRFRVPDLLARVDRIERSGHPVFARLAQPLRAALAKVDGSRDPSLPRGLIHGDLFRDNVLWDTGGEVAALLDFESACLGTYAYDLMVTVLAWCFGDDLDARLASAMREGYEEVRPLSAAEVKGLHAEGRLAALRFTVTRITDYAMRTDAVGDRVVKDWGRFRKRFDRLETLGPDGLRDVLGR
jgi:homoserine kinase type II